MKKIFNKYIIIITFVICLILFIFQSINTNILYLKNHNSFFEHESFNSDFTNKLNLNIVQKYLYENDSLTIKYHIINNSNETIYLLNSFRLYNILDDANFFPTSDSRVNNIYLVSEKNKGIGVLQAISPYVKNELLMINVNSETAISIKVKIDNFINKIKKDPTTFYTKLVFWKKSSILELDTLNRFKILNYAETDIILDKTKRFDKMYESTNISNDFNTEKNIWVDDIADFYKKYISIRLKCNLN